MILKTERLTIRHITQEDWKSIQEIWVDFNASKYAQFDMPHITDDANVKARVAKWAAANHGTEHMFFAVCLEKRLIGYIAFNIRESGYEIGYCFHSKFHGKGYAKESHIALFDYLKTLGITKYSAGTAMDNEPSVKLLISLGFQLVGKEQVSFYKDARGNDIIFEGGIFEMEYSGCSLIPYDEQYEGVLRCLLTDYYREGEDALTPQEELDRFIDMLFDLCRKKTISGCIAYEKKAVGFAFWGMDTDDFPFSNKPGFGTILEIGVIPSARGAGLGGQLVECAEKVLDCGKFYVCAYGPAEKFWKKCHYRETGEIADNGLKILQKV